MNISSILITIIGIIIILALYLVSRANQKKLPQDVSSNLPNIKDQDGKKFSSVLDDIPATDDSTPSLNQSTNDVKKTKPVSNSKENNKQDSKTKQAKQVVLFISALDENGLSGDLIQEVLQKNDLILADKDIYHFHINNNENKKVSLFRVANGVAPWTLTAKDLKQKSIAGLSLVMSLSSKIDKKEALTTFIKKADTIAKAVNGTLKNQQQQPFTAEDRAEIYATFKQ